MVGKCRTLFTWQHSQPARGGGVGGLCNGSVALGSPLGVAGGGDLLHDVACTWGLICLGRESSMALV